MWASFKTTSARFVNDPIPRAFIRDDCLKIMMTN